MTAYRYEAARGDGAMVRGVVDAASGADAVAVLSARGLLPVRVEAQPAPGTWHLTRHLSVRDQAMVLQSLTSLVGAGVPLERALRATEPIASPRLREVLRRVGARVREGASLGAALAAEHGRLSGVTIGLIRAGEGGVGLPAALEQAAAQLEREAETVARVRGALAYPVVLAVVGTVSVGVIALFVVPRFAALLADVGQSLPLATRLLLGAAGAARRFGWVLAVVLAAGAGAAVRMIQERQVAWHTWLLRLPLIGPIRHALATARISRTLGSLLGSGTPALAALAIARDAAADAAVADRLTRSRERVAEGASLSAALASTGALTETALQLVAIGEGSGRVPALLGKAAELEERDAERRLRTLVTFLEPALILAFAGLVAFVAAALLQAVYSLRPGP
jgi:general secretion pathway protein F